MENSEIIQSINWRVLPLFALTFILYFHCGAQAMATQSNAEMGRLSATVVWWPQGGPPKSAKQNEALPAIGVEFLIAQVDGSETEFSVVTDSNGKFTIDLPIGEYRIMRKPNNIYIGKQWVTDDNHGIRKLPLTFTILKDSDIHLHITMDGGVLTPLP